MGRCAILLIILVSVGCRDEPAGQQTINLAEKHADESAHQLELARQEARHQQRLREIDRTRLESQAAELQTVWALWRLWLGALALLLVILLVWLAREIRLRRLLAFILAGIRKGGEA